MWPVSFEIVSIFVPNGIATHINRYTKRQMNATPTTATATIWMVIWREKRRFFCVLVVIVFIIIIIMFGVCVWSYHRFGPLREPQDCFVNYKMRYGQQPTQSLHHASYKLNRNQRKNTHTQISLQFGFTCIYIKMFILFIFVIIIWEWIWFSFCFIPLFLILCAFDWVSELFFLCLNHKLHTYCLILEEVNR